MVADDLVLQDLRRKPRVLFVSEDDSTYTQIALSYMQALGSDLLDVRSAGLQSCRINPMVAETMREDGMEIQTNRTDLISGETLTWADLVITIARDQDTVRVAIPNSAHHRHWPLRLPPDQPGAADDTRSQCRRWRDEIKQRVQGMLQAMRLFRVA